jgi:hypothetical protein
MLLPGTFLGVWNLFSISSDHTHHPLSAAWVQAHGHAQIFGWIGSFVIAIGFFSLSKMGSLHAKAVSRGWLAWTLWACGVLGAWSSGVYGWHWRVLLPASALLECCGYLIFFILVRQHRPARQPKQLPVVGQKPAAWMRLVMGSSIAFLSALVLRLAVAIHIAIQGGGPQFPAWADRALLAVSVWGFLVLSVWGFNARWLSLFAGFRPVNDRGLLRAMALNGLGVMLAMAGLSTASAITLLAAVFIATAAMGVFEKSARPEQASGMYSSLPTFVRVAYCWLSCAAVLGIWAATNDVHGGIVGASRHAVTVGFIGTMVFAIGQKLLPTFCGQRSLFSKRVMLLSLTLLNAGCFLRVASEIPAYEFHSAFGWTLLPVSAVLELTAVAVFAFNLSVSILRPRTTRYRAAQRAAA